MSAWPRKFRTYWCVVDPRGTAFLSTARQKKSSSIEAWVIEASNSSRALRLWAFWKRQGYSCQLWDIKVRSASEAGPRGRR